MSNYKPLDDRQVINRAALTHIGSPANDSLDDIFNRIDAIISGLSSGGGYIAKKTSLTNGSTSLAVTIPSQPDTSYVVLAMMGNTTDAFPQYQQVEVTAKSTSGFTLSWNHPLDTANYFMSFVVPFKSIQSIESSISSAQNNLAVTLPIAQSGSGYGVITELQNLVDTHPQFQSVVVGSNTTNTANFSWNVATDSASYQNDFMLTATGQIAISNGATSVTVPMPVNFNTSNYAIIASIQNTVDSHPQYQPMIVKAQNGTSATIGWNVACDSGNYTISYYAISLTP